MGEGAFRSVEALFRPRSIAIVGASDAGGANWTKAIHENLLAMGANVPVYPINPRRATVWGERCYPSFAALPQAVDLALVVTPAATIPATLGEGAAHGLRAATIYAAGFGENGDPAGAALAAELTELANGGLRLCGPNCMGSLSLAERLYLYPATRVRDAGLGEVGVAMQSGGVFQYWLQTAAARGLGFSYAVSSGNELDLDLTDYINFFVEDERTRVICALAEGIRRPRAFMAAAAKALAARKPIVIVKIGRSEGARISALSHTGALAGDDRVFDAVCERYGIIRVPSLDDLIEHALAFRSGRSVRAGATMFVGYSGSARGIVLDAAHEVGLELAQLTPDTTAALAKHVDPAAVLENPIDLGAGIARDAERYGRVCAIVARDPNVGVLAVQSQLPLEGERFDPQWFAGVTGATDRPVFGYARTQQNVLEGGRAFQAATGMPHLQGIPRSVLAAKHLVAYGRRLARPPRTARAVAGGLLDGVPVPAERLARTPADAVALAEAIGYPVALKLHATQPIHKTELQGVKLDLRDAAAVARAADALFATIAAAPELGCDGVLVQEMVDGLELFVGMRRDPHFGPCVLVGLGGVFVEAFDDLAARLLPVDADDVHAMLGEVRGRRVLGPFRGRAPRDVAAVAACVVALGDAFVAAGDDVEDVEINPLVVLEHGHGVRAVDVRVVDRRTAARAG